MPVQQLVATARLIKAGKLTVRQLLPIKAWKGGDYSAQLEHEEIVIRVAPNFTDTNSIEDRKRTAQVGIDNLEASIAERKKTLETIASDLEVVESIRESIARQEEAGEALDAEGNPLDMVLHDRLAVQRAELLDAELKTSGHEQWREEVAANLADLEARNQVHVDAINDLKNIKIIKPQTLTFPY